MLLPLPFWSWSLSLLTEQDSERGNEKIEVDDMRREYIKEKWYKIEEMWECEWWETFKVNDKIKNQIITHFPCERPLSTDSFLTKKMDIFLANFSAI